MKLIPGLVVCGGSPSRWRHLTIIGAKLAVVAMSALAAILSGPSAAQAGLIITPTFTANFVTDFGANAAAAENAWIAAANIFESTFTNNIHVNITVDAVADTSVFGQSNSFLTGTSNYSTIYNLLKANATSTDQLTSVGSGGSVSATNPASGAVWWMTTAEAKALGFEADNLNNDGTTTFGAGNPFTFSGPIAPGTYDFQGVAAHEISEVLGRQGLKGGSVGGHSPSYSVMDLFSYTGPGSRSLAGGANDYFSINAGTTLIKEYNNYLSNGLDSRDWAPGTNDAFNQFSDSGVVNAVSGTDIRELNVIGYDLAAVPEPMTLSLWSLGAAIAVFARRRSRCRSG